MTVRFARPRHFLSPSVAAAMLVGLLAAAPIARGEESPRTVTTTGTATVYVTPDRVDIRFTVFAYDADLAKAKAQNDEAANKALAFLKSSGIDEKAIATEFASTEPVYGQERHDDGRVERGPIKGYNVSRSYGVRLDDVSKFAGILDRLLTDANVTVGGHSFSSKNDRTHRDQARRDAAIAAREKAQLLAGTLDARVGAPRTIEESTVSPIYRPMLSNSFRAGPGQAGGGEDASPIGQIEIRAEVTVAFDLVPNS